MLKEFKKYKLDYAVEKQTDKDGKETYNFTVIANNKPILEELRMQAKDYLSKAEEQKDKTSADKYYNTFVKDPKYQKHTSIGIKGKKPLVQQMAAAKVKAASLNAERQQPAKHRDIGAR